MVEPIDIEVRLVENGVPIREKANQHSTRSAGENLQGETGDQAKQTANKTLETLKDIKNLNTAQLEGAQRRNAELMKFASEGAQRIASGLKGIMTKSIEVVEMIYKKLSAASPLLQAIEQLFNLAWTIFFMPIGNKIGELLIPAVIELVDSVVAFWEEYGDGGLGDMVAGAVEWGVQALGEFFAHIGDALAEQTGWVGTIGTFLQKLGSFIENNGENLINLVGDWALWNLEHMGTIITLIGTFMTLHYALQIATMAVIAASNHPVIGGILGTAAAGVAIAGIAASYNIGSQFNMAEGGYVPATPGGQIKRLAEAGEGEYVIPESKMGQMGGNTYHVNVYSYSTEELRSIIKDVISEEISSSRLRSGF